MLPEAPISARHVVAHVSGDPPANKAKRMGDELSALPATGSAGADGVSPSVDESASTGHIDASVLGNERHIPDPCHRGIVPCRSKLLAGSRPRRRGGPRRESESLYIKANSRSSRCRARLASHRSSHDIILPATRAA